MVSHSFSVESPLPVGDAFTRAIDLTRVAEWDHGVQASTQIQGTAPVRGARYEVTVTGFDGRPDKLVYELTEVDTPHRFVMTGENATMRAVDTLVFTTTEGGCVLDYTGTLELLGEDPPLTDTQLASVFPKIAAVAESGLRTYLT